MAAAAGVAVTYGVVELVIRARPVLVLIGLAQFIAIGLDPVVAWLTRRLLPIPAVVLAFPGQRLRRHGIPVGHLLAWITAEGASADGPP